MGVYRQTTGEAPPLTPRHRRRRRWKILFSLFALFALVVVILTVVQTRRRVLAVGYVTTEDYAAIRSPVAGIVETIHLSSGSMVASGDLLVQLDDREERASLEESESQIRKISAEISQLEAEIVEKGKARKRSIEMAQLRLEYAQIKLERTRELTFRGLAAGRSLEDAELNEKLTKVELESLLSEDFDTDTKRLAVLKEERNARQDVRKRVQARLQSRQILAPIGGQVLRYEFVPGELVQPDRVIYEIFGGEKKILKLRVPERYATLIHPGQDYRAELKSYGGIFPIWFRGKVVALRDVIQTSNEQTYRSVYCDFNPEDYSVPPGTTVEAEIVVDHSPLWKALIGIY